MPRVDSVSPAEALPLRARVQRPPDSSKVVQRRAWMHAAQHSPGVRLWSEVDGDELGWTHVPVSRRHCHGVVGGMPLSVSDLTPGIPTSPLRLVGER